MKKLISILMVFILIMIPIKTLAEPINANDQLDLYQQIRKDSIGGKKINEYDEFKNLQNTDEKELLTLGWTVQEIKDLKEFDFEKAVKERALLSNEQLSKMGYSSDKISLFNEISDEILSEEDLRALAGVLTLNVSFRSIANAGRDWYIDYGWFWDPQPIFLMKDIVGVKALGSVNGTVAIPTLMSDSTCFTTYEYYNMQYSHKIDSTFKRVDLNLAQNVFNMQSTGSSGLKTWARSGSGRLHFNNTTTMDRFKVAIQYGHSQFAFDPSIDLSIGGGISGGVSFGFSKNVNTEANVIKEFTPNGTEL